MVMANIKRSDTLKSEYPASILPLRDSWSPDYIAHERFCERLILALQDPGIRAALVLALKETQRMEKEKSDEGA